MNLQNGTLDTRLPQNVIRNFEIPANVEHDKLNPFKIGGGNAIWATHLPPNVSVWFSTNPNFDNAQKLDYMNRGMRFMSIGSDGLQQQYDNFYIFTEGTWDDSIKIAVSSQGDMVEPILSSNTGDIENVGRVAAISKMPVNGASGYNEPDFEIWCENKIAARLDIKDSVCFCQKMDYNFLNFIPNKKYLFEIDFLWSNNNFFTTGGDYVYAYSPTLLAFGFLKTGDNLRLIEWDESMNMRVCSNLEPFFLYEKPKELGDVQQDITPNVKLQDILKNGNFKMISFITYNRDKKENFHLMRQEKKKIIIDGKKIKDRIPIILINSTRGVQDSTFSGFFDFFVRVYSL